VAATQVNVEKHAKDIAEQNAERKNHIQPPECCSAGPKLLSCTSEVNDCRGFRADTVPILGKVQEAILIGQGDVQLRSGSRVYKQQKARREAGLFGV
jgi:hypothetical protein